MIRVSDITMYLKCPRVVYFMNKGNELIRNITPGYLEKIIIKELALSYPDASDKEDMVSFLEEELERLSGEIRIIYRSELAGIDDELVSGSISSVSTML
ncbi:MAG: hypothetical protein ACNA7I_08615, partial [Candidatus Methanoperedens sp.]